MKSVMLASASIVALALSSCIGTPDYYELSPAYGRSDFIGRETDFETSSLMFTLGWSPKQQAHWERMENLAISALARDKGVSVEKVKEELNQDHHAQTAQTIIPQLPSLPKTTEEANMMLIWVVAVLALSGMAAIVFLLKDKGTKKERTASNAS